MSGAPTLVTPRLVLRPWRDDDLPEFAALNADPRVMEHFLEPLERLGMSRSPLDDFEHPNLPESHPLRPHMLYRLKRAD